MTPLVTIICCTYNRDALLPRAINSVVAQTYGIWELVVVDDGSTDTTKLVVQRMQEDDSRLRYFYQDHCGLSRARNMGLAMSRGEFICFIDSDDEFGPRHIERRLAYMRRHPEIDFIYGGMKLVGPRHRRYVVDLDNHSAKTHLSHCYAAGTFFFRRSLLDLVGGFSPVSFGEDYDFYKRTEAVVSVARVNYRTYFYHVDSTNRLCEEYTKKILEEKGPGANGTDSSDQGPGPS